MKYYLFIVLFGAIIVHSYAQNTCTQRLNQAEDDYDAGRLLGIPDRLKICLESEGFTEEEEKRARKLLTLVYIFTDHEKEAEAAMIDLLKVDPEHQLDPQVDPAELYFLYDQFRVDPIFRIAGRFGVTSSRVHVLRERSTDTENYPKFYNGRPSRELTAEESKFIQAEGGLGIGLFGEVLIERHLVKGLEVALGPQFRYTTYNVEAAVSNVEAAVSNAQDTKPVLDASLTHRQLYFRSPLVARYTLWYDRREKKFLPYVFAGGSYDFLLSAGYPSFSRDGGTSTTPTHSDVIKNNQVNRTNFSLTGGIGVKMRTKTNFFTLEVRYDNSLKPYTNGENAYVDQRTLFEGAFVEDDVSLDVLSFSFGYTWSIYNPKKIK